MIIRNKDRKTFTIISNQAINDTQLSDKALGTLVRLLSKTDNWNLNVNYMVKTGKQGRTAIRSSIAELEKAGYIHKQLVRTKSGQITGTQYHVYEDAVAGKQVSATIPEQPTSSQVKAPTRDEARRSETRQQETDPVVNTNIEQTLKVTTTTTQNLTPEATVEVVEETPSSYPATEDINFLLNLIPEQHQQPMVMALVNQAVKKYTPLEMEEAIVYSSANVKGGWMQYKAYLDKTLKNKWAAGYLDTISTTTPTVLSPGKFAGAMPAGRFPNGTVTGSARMDSNYMACAEFLAEMGVKD